MLGLDQLRATPEKDVSAAVDEAIQVLSVYTDPSSDYDEYLKAKMKVTMEPPFGLSFVGPMWLAERALYEHACQHGYITDQDLGDFANNLYRWRDPQTAQIIGSDRDKETALVSYEQLFGRMAKGFEQDPMANKTYAQLASLGNAALHVQPRSR